MRGFDAARTDRLLASWSFDGGFTSDEVRSSLGTIRSRSRDMAKNSEHFKRWLQLIATNVTGEGFALKSTPHDGTPIAPKLDDKAARYIEYHWWAFCTGRDSVTGKTYFDASGRKTAAEMDRLNVKTWARDGEYFIEPVAAANPYGVSFRVIRPDMIDHEHNEILSPSVAIRCGVEVDTATLRPLAYWSAKQKPGLISSHPYFVQSNSGGRYRIPAESIIHGFTPEDEDQPRGIPWAHATLKKLKMLDEYDRAELTAARDEACTVHTYEATNSAADPTAFQDLTKEDPGGVGATLLQEKQPGQAEILPYGYTKKTSTPSHPNRELTPFKASMLKDIASGLGVEYSNFANDWSGVSFSSVRVGTISERDMWIVLQNDYIAQCKSRQFLMWLPYFLSSEANKMLPPEKVAKFREHEFRGRRWMWVDPMKDMNAAKMAVDNGWKTNTQVAGDMGTDYTDNIEELNRETLIKAGGKKDDVPVLNGAQITAALEIVQSYATGGIGEGAAVSLLTAAGVPPDAAASMIKAQKVSVPAPVVSPFAEDDEEKDEEDDEK